MKASLHTIALFVVLSLSTSSCKQDKYEGSGPVTELRKGIASLNVQDQAEIFYHLPANIKSELWRDRISEVMEDCNSDQKELLEEIRKQIKPEIYDFDSAFRPDRSKFESYLIGWKARADLQFKGKDSSILNDMMSRLGPENDASTITQGAPPKPNCDCQSTSNFCSNGCPPIPKSNCRMVQGGWPWYIWYDGLCK